MLKRKQMFFSRFEEFQVSNFQTIHRKLTLDKIFSSVSELHFDPAFLYDQELQIEESATEIITRCVQRTVHIQVSYIFVSVSGRAWFSQSFSPQTR